MLIRPEAESDHDLIRLVNEEAFGRTDEAVLVDQLRRDGAVLLSLIALDGNRGVGHIMFNRLPIHAPRKAVCASAEALRTRATSKPKTTWRS